MSQNEPPSFGWASGQTAYSNAYIEAPVLRVLAKAGAGSVLDAGCGNGHFTRRLNEVGYRVVGIDADSTGVEVARRDAAHLDFRQFFFGDDPTSLYPNGAPFDAVVSTEVIEHLYAPHELTSFAFKALRPGGIFVISTPYHGYLKNLALSLANGWDRHFHPDKHGGHIKFFSRSTLSKLLTDAGFVVTDFIGAGRYPGLWKSMILVARRPE